MTLADIRIELRLGLACISACTPAGRVWLADHVAADEFMQDGPVVLVSEAHEFAASAADVGLAAAFS